MHVNIYYIFLFETAENIVHESIIATLKIRQPEEIVYGKNISQTNLYLGAHAKNKFS